MVAVRNLYQEVILDHNKRPRNFRRLEDASHHAHGHNPLCGDQVDVYLRVDGERVADIAFEGDSCAISTASASIMTELLHGRSLEEAGELLERFNQLVADGAPTASAEAEALDVLAGVRMFPARVKCALLPWHTLQAALRRESSASTE